MVQRCVVVCAKPFYKDLTTGPKVGQYAKCGGAGFTDDLQEAEIIGWTRSCHKRWKDRYGDKIVLRAIKVEFADPMLVYLGDL